MRPIWSGALSFGLINIPVRLYGASEERALKFRLLDKHGHCPISYARICRTTNRKVRFEDIVKGYEYRKGDYVVLSDEDFKKAVPRKTSLIEVQQFTAEEEIPSEIINKPYYIEPDKRAEKAYVLLREALKRSGQVGIAKFVLRNKENLAMIKPEDRALLLITLRYHDEIRPSTDLNLPAGDKFTKKELDMALALIDQLRQHFDASEYRDTYTAELKKIINRKAKGKPIKIADAEKELAPTDMRKLMETLRLSLEKERAR